MDPDTTEASVEKTKATAVPVTQTEGQDPEAVQKALEAVQKIVGSVTSLITKGKKADMEEDEDDGKKKPPFAKTKKEDNEEPPVKKAAEPTKAEVVKSAEDALYELGDSIKKAARFTPARVEQLKAAMETLKLVIEGVEPGTAPSTKTPDGSFGGSQVKPTGTEPTAVVKAAEGDALERITKALTDLGETVTKALTGMNERLDGIEKAKPAPAGEGEQGTQNKTVTKSLWGGIL